MQQSYKYGSVRGASGQLPSLPQHLPLRFRCNLTAVVTDERAAGIGIPVIAQGKGAKDRYILFLEYFALTLKAYLAA